MKNKFTLSEGEKLIILAATTSSFISCLLKGSPFDNEFESIKFCVLIQVYRNL